MGFDVDDLRKRQDRLETTNRSVFLDGTYIMFRLDGRAFSNLSKKYLERPFDIRFAEAMKCASSHILKEFRPHLIYTQSDEITIVFDKGYEDFGRRKEKMLSLLAASASAVFKTIITDLVPELEGQYPIFDCRGWEVTTVDDVAGNLILRQQDCIRNSISMLHDAVCGKKGSSGMKQHQKLDALHAADKSWNSIEPHFKYGTFLRMVERPIPADDPSFDTVPVQYRPTEPVIRRVVDMDSIELPKDISAVSALLSKAA